MPQLIIMALKSRMLKAPSLTKSSSIGVKIVSVAAPPPPPPPEKTGVVLRAETGRQSVRTSQLSQSKVSVPTKLPVALPWNWPAESMVTPEKSIQPRPSPQALPPSVPSPLFVIPPLEGVRLIQAVLPFQASHVRPASVTWMFPSVRPKFTQPALFDQA